MPLKNKNFNKLPDPLAEKAKSEAAVQKSNTAQRKKQSKFVDAMVVKPAANSVADVFDKEFLSVL